MTTSIYHNPRCSKSRQTLQLLQDNNIEVTVIEYLKQIPDTNEIKTLLKQLGMDSAQQLMRKGEAIYKQLNLKDSAHSEEQLINAMIENPKLIERPIVVHGNAAKIGRPPEQVLALFK